MRPFQLAALLLVLLGTGTARGQEDEELKLKTFNGGQRSLQALNPEISLTGDFYTNYIRSTDGREYFGGERSGAFMRVMGLHMQSNLDPFTLMKAAVELHDHGVEVGEAYATWTSVLPGVSLTAGKFRQRLGVVNRWHKHGLDQFDFPSMVTTPFGHHGLNQTGLSAGILLPPLWCDSLEMTVEVTNGSNEQLFAGDYFSVPVGLLHVANYWDLTDSTYLELGFSGMFGFNNRRGIAEDSSEGHEEQEAEHEQEHEHTGEVSGGTVNEDWRTTIVGGADLTLNWEPLNRSKYHYFTWRSEFLFVQKEMPGGDTLRWMGGYSYLEYKLNRSWIAGVRGDLVQPFELENEGRWDWQAVPYVTWWQSPWVRLRLEYDYHVPDAGLEDHRVLLQLTFAAGPHKHERY